MPNSEPLNATPQTELRSAIPDAANSPIYTPAATHIPIEEQLKKRMTLDYDFENVQ
jgi:hypothetical protein